jgi:outer membrane protein insertion porin family
MRGWSRWLAVVSVAVGVSGARAQATDARPPVTVDTLLVVGNRRLDDAAVRALAGLAAGQRIGPAEVTAALRRLMASDQFDYAAVYAEPTAPGRARLWITVVERPLVAAWEFEGLAHVRPATVRDTLRLQPGQPLSPTRVARIEQTIRALLAKRGYPLAHVDTLWRPAQAPGQVRVVFRVVEGPPLAIADVKFVGNRAFSDERLAGVLATKPEGFWWFRTGRLDRERLRQDLAERLPEFYSRHGYLDFVVRRDTVLVDSISGKARLIIEVDEGPQYRLGEFRIEGNTRFPTDVLAGFFLQRPRSLLGISLGTGAERQSGEIFDRVAMDAALRRVQQLYTNEGYLYAQVEPRIIKVAPSWPGEAPRVDVTWIVREGNPFYVRYVLVRGNTYTHESVIRDRIVLLPGDVYSEDRLVQSYQAIAALGYFETPLPTPEILPDPQQSVVDIVFHVKEKQTGSLSFGTTIGGYAGAGLAGFLGYSQPNLFGKGKQAELRLEYGFNRTSFYLSYSDPSIRDSRYSGSFSAFHTDDRYRGFTFDEGRYIRTGLSLQLGVPVFNLRWTRAFVGYALTHYRYEVADTAGCATNIFCQPSALASSLSLGLTRDTKNHPLFPTAGARHSISLAQYGGPLGGQGNFQKLLFEGQWWVPVGQFGGGGVGSRPIRTALGLQIRTGAVFGDASRFPLERFFLGGVLRGEPLRGYDELEITPDGFVDRQDRTFPSIQRLGDAFLTTTAEFAVRLSDNLSVSVFGDAGNLWRDPGQINPLRLFRSLGVGATIVTPFGPLGLDWAYGFDKPNPGWKLHFKLGNIF